MPPPSVASQILRAASSVRVDILFLVRPSLRPYLIMLLFVCWLMPLSYVLVHMFFDLSIINRYVSPAWGQYLLYSFNAPLLVRLATPRCCVNAQSFPSASKRGLTRKSLVYGHLIVVTLPVWLLYRSAELVCVIK